MTSIIIPATSLNKQYTDFAIHQIRELYPDETKVEIVVEINDSVSLGINYNNAVAREKGDIVILMHNDMVPHPGFVETIEKHMTRKRVLVYHRLEPPIYLDTYPGKTIYNCGSDIQTYNKDKFFNYHAEDILIDGGSQLFFAVCREDYLNIDGDTFKKFCEDDDVHLRYKLADYDCKVANGAMVYHFVSKTSRIGDYQEIEKQSNISFIKKWGFRNSIYNKVYKKAIKFTSPPSEDLYNTLSLWFNTTPNDANVLVEIDVSIFTQKDYYYITQLNDIIAENSEIGSFELGTMKVTIKSLDSFEKDLIFI
jgi:hypothetical protein